MYKAIVQVVENCHEKCSHGLVSAKFCTINMSHKMIYHSEYIENNTVILSAIDGKF